jgi:hypothetical protein
MRTTSTLLLVLGFTAFTTAAVMGTAGKIPGLRSHGFLGMNAYAEPVAAVINADQQQLSRANAWSQYRAQVKACALEPVNRQDACLQQARRERKQNSGVARKSHAPKPKLANTQIASVE